MKKCPFCAEEIQDDAIVCRFCGRDLKTGQIPQSTIAPKKKRNPIITFLAALSLVVIICGCLWGVLNSYTKSSNGDTSQPTQKQISQATNTIVSPTNTPLPPATQTRLFIDMQNTSTSLAATETQTAKNSYKTATVQARNAQATEIAQYKSLDWRELVNYADAHIGEKIIIRGRVFNINSNKEFQMYISGTYEAVYVVTEDTFTGLYENNSITVYGTINGENCGKNAFGGTVCQPLLIDAFFVKP